MSQYVQTDTILDRILAHKVEELDQMRRLVPMAQAALDARTAPPPLDVVGALRRDTVALVAEVKRASPSRGQLIENFDPVGLAQVYARSGAAMISVLTDREFFQGDLSYLKAIRGAVDVPLLRKEFIIDAYQIYEARAAGADAVLLIAAALEDGQLSDLYALACELGMTPLIEVHNEAELLRVLNLNPSLIGINNRDLKTFDVDLGTTEQLAAQVPDGVTLVAESGILNPLDVHKMGRLGAHAVLVGEGLVTADDIAETVRAFSSQERQA